MNKEKSKPKGKALNKKDQEKLREKHRRELEEAKIEQEKEIARQQCIYTIIKYKDLKRQVLSTHISSF